MHKLRLLRLFLSFLLGRRSNDPLRPVVCRFMITPLDAEVTRAVSHAYLAFAGLGRWFYCFHNIDWRGLLREKWAPLTQSEIIQYRRAAILFSRVEVTTTAIWWDEKMMYFEHSFKHGDTLCATSFSRGAFYKGRQRLAPVQCIKGLPEEPPMSKPGIVDYWNAGSEHLLGSGGRR